MPPKKEERKPLQSIFEPEPFYQYHKPTLEEIEQTNQFLQYFKPDLLPLMKGNVYENMSTLFTIIGLAIHPSFIRQTQIIDINDFDENKKFKNPDDNDNDQQPLILSINTVKIDLLTFKLLEFCIGLSNIQILKFCNNNLDETEFSFIFQIINAQDSKVKKLFIDWQTVHTIQQIQYLDQLSLRSCNITQDQSIVEGICQNWKNLKYLDLYDNKLTKESLDILGQMLKENNQLEQLGLAKNGLKIFDYLSSIVMNVGKFLMTQEEVDEYRVKEKERDAIIERNKKVKKKGTEEIVPLLEPIQQFENNWYIMRNQKLQLLNLAMNFFDDSSLNEFDKFICQTHENFIVVITQNKFEDSKLIQKIKKKLGKKIII